MAQMNEDLKKWRRCAYEKWRMNEAEESLEGTSIKRVRKKKLYICPKSAMKKTCDTPGETYKRDLHIYTKAMKSSISYKVGQVRDLTYFIALCLR